MKERTTAAFAGSALDMGCIGEGGSGGV